jgi:hypothetical protein
MRTPGGKTTFFMFKNEGKRRGDEILEIWQIKGKAGTETRSSKQVKVKALMNITKSVTKSRIICLRDDVA